MRDPTLKEKGAVVILVTAVLIPPVCLAVIAALAVTAALLVPLMMFGPIYCLVFPDRVRVGKDGIYFNKLGISTRREP